MSTTVNGSDPEVYLANGIRLALGIAESNAPESVVQAAQDAYHDATGTWPYVQGMPNTPSKAPDPDPKPTIGNVTGTGDDVNEAGDNVAFDKGATSTVTAEFDGDAEDVTYKWEIRTGGENLSIVGDSTEAAVELQGDDGGSASIRCTLTSGTAGDSPQTLTMSVIVKEPAGP